MTAPRETALTLPDPGNRADLGAFVARVVQLDPGATVRLVGAGGLVTAWASTPFDVLATRSAPGSLEPGDVTVPAMALLTALTVERATTVDPGAGERWRGGDVPPADGWAPVDDVPAAELERLTATGLEQAGAQGGPDADLLDGTALTLTGPDGRAVRVPMRCLFALSGLGFAEDPGAVRVSAARSWLRLDARHGAVVRRRITTLPLLV